LSQNLVSIIALCFNHEKYVIQTLNSIINQNCKDFELIITDDGSSDLSRDLIRNWVHNQNGEINIKLCFNETNSGLCKTLNLAISNASGQWIKPISCDDILEVNYLKKIINKINKNNTVSLWSTDMSIINSEGFCIHKSIWEFNKIDISTININDFNLLCNAQYLNAPSLIYRKNLWNEVGGYDENLNFEDWDFLLRSKLVAQFGYLKESLVRYRIHNSNMHLNFNTSTKYNLDCIKLLKKHELNVNIRESILNHLNRLINIDYKSSIASIYNELDILTINSDSKIFVSIVYDPKNTRFYDSLHSILLQTYKNIAIVIKLNDENQEFGSELLELQKKDSRIVLEEAINKTFNLKSNNYVFYANPIVFFYPNTIEKYYNFLISNPKCQSVSSIDLKTSVIDFKCDLILGNIHSVHSVLTKNTNFNLFNSLEFQKYFLEKNIQILDKQLYCEIPNILEKPYVNSEDLETKVTTTFRMLNIDKSNEIYQKLFLNHILLKKDFENKNEFLQFSKFSKYLLLGNTNLGLVDNTLFRNYLFKNYWIKNYLFFINEFSIKEYISICSDKVNMTPTLHRLKHVFFKLIKSRK
jgi:glycosyltransferase involved in cell wall biosynthesis